MGQGAEHGEQRRQQQSHRRPGARPFTEARARELLASAAGHEHAGHDEQAVAGVGAATGEHAVLLALGENAVFALDPPHAPEPLVVRVGRDPSLLARAERELRVAAWLEQQRVPAVRAARPEVTVVDGHPLTYWRRLPEPVREATPADLAVLLRLVHALETPEFELPRRDLLSGVERWLRLAGDAVPAADAAYLRARRDDFDAAVAELTPVLPPGPLHGDALPRNVHVGPDGPLLVDLETFSDDLREHDLVVLTLSLDRYGLDEAAYSGFVRAYGWDVREWPGCAVLRGARETAACAWVAQHAPANPAARREFDRRVESLRRDDAAVRWYAF
ncbi:phosphotransferase [Streptomyces marispadix]|uniref:Aminoglycoside phosphotransferase family protein n=1 Tax=Streptomyces marispadix TaxID=2922868 RepID=A0ABS9SXH4_9ACTN|nr:aminoglycoside phosphotransferase family protein [Streptomyces marispadix]MCH6160962.1 aminoglycoside phosphotransferase family protein [Streptomyces marispadix]